LDVVPLARWTVRLRIKPSTGANEQGTQSRAQTAPAAFLPINRLRALAQSLAVKLCLRIGHLRLQQ
jgi:hypothetical protein